MKYNLYQEIIENYIDAYNNYDIDRMLSFIHEDIKFENISNGEINLTMKENRKLQILNLMLTRLKCKLTIEEF